MSKDKKPSKTKTPLPVALPRLVQGFIADQLTTENLQEWLSSLWEYRADEVIKGLYLNRNHKGGAGIDWLNDWLDPCEGASLEEIVDNFIAEHGADPVDDDAREYLSEISQSFDRMAEKLRKLVP